MVITFSKDLGVEVHNVIMDDEGRYIILYTTVNKKKFLFANVYAPNQDKPKFFQKWLKDLKRFTPNYVVVGGDFNLALNPELDRLGTHHNNEKSASFLKSSFENEQLVDVWRFYNEDKTCFTWYRKVGNKISYSRKAITITKAVSSEGMQSVSKTHRKSVPTGLLVYIRVPTAINTQSKNSPFFS